MPSPLGHMLGGVAAGWLVSGVPVRGGGPGAADRVRSAVTYACLGAVPDLDLLIGVHRGPTHSIGAALIVGIAAGALLYFTGLRRSLRSATTLAAACAAAFGSHVLLDWLSSDNSAPIGIMALWPLDHDFYTSDLHVFMAISRRYYHGWTFVWQNLLAVTREVAILLPLVSLVMILRQRPELR
jgi:inner membrane protein